MKAILFCQNPYAFGIMAPIMEALRTEGDEFLWFLTENLRESFPFPSEPHTFDIEEIVRYQSDVIFCPGNEVPHYLRGVKTQIFHGLAGEKKGHFRIRHYFDLYLTQGPYFTRRFNRLKRRFRNFEVIETGWPKLDIYARNVDNFQSEKKELLSGTGSTRILLYAPTFSPSLTSAPFLAEELRELAQDQTNLILIKFHDLMAPDLIRKYRQLGSEKKNIILVEDPNIVKYLLMADLLISDTSSVVYEFLLLDKPVITFGSNSETKVWEDSREYKGLSEMVARNLKQDPYREERKQVIASYHPYQDGRSAYRMVEAVKDYIARNGVPERRKLPILRRRKINRMFKRKKRNFL